MHFRAIALVKKKIQMNQRRQSTYSSTAPYHRAQSKYAVRHACKTSRFIRLLALFASVLLTCGLVLALNFQGNSGSCEASQSLTVDDWNLLDSEGFSAGQGVEPPESVVARNVFVAEIKTHRAIFERDSTERIAPASTAKIATALTALDCLSLDEEVRVGGEINLIDESSSRAWLAEGDVLTFEQLLYALMLPSGNDAAYTIAVHAGRAIIGNGDASDEVAIKVFMDRVNEKVRELGAANTHLVVPDGFDADGQYTTAVDLAILAEACLNDPVLAEVVSTYESVEQWPDGEVATFYNTNQLIDPQSEYYMPAAVGIKTGSTSVAGACLVSAAHIDGETVVCVVMGSDATSRFQDSIELYEAVPLIKHDAKEGK